MGRRCFATAACLQSTQTARVGNFASRAVQMAGSCVVVSERHHKSSAGGAVGIELARGARRVA